MDRQLIERLKTFLENEGFAQLEIHRSSTSQTLSGSKETTRLVMHLADGVALPARAEAVAGTPADRIVTRPIVPGLTQAITGLPRLGGGGGAVAGRQSHTDVPAAE